MKATSNYLNLPLRTEQQARREVLTRRFTHCRNFKVRSVFYGEGYARSSPRGVEPALDTLADAYGVYGNDVRECPEEPLQYLVHDCDTLSEAETLATHLNRSV